MHRMKGMGIDTIWWTLIVLLVAVFCIVFLIGIGLLTSIFPDEKSKSISFVKTRNDPYSEIEALSAYQPNIRKISEHALESIIVSSIANAGSNDAIEKAKEFLKKYENRISILSLERDGKEFFSATKVYQSGIESLECGENAYCMGDSQPFDPKISGICPVGTVEIKGKCPEGKYCCQLNEAAYLDPSRSKEQPNTPKDYPIVRCGKNDAGICNPMRVIYIERTTMPTVYCGNGFIEIDDEGACTDELPTCCALISSQSLGEEKIAETASMPFLYKGKTLFETKEYRCQDVNTRCDGEYVRGLCPGLPENIQCCITDEIRCMPPNSYYFCMDISHCEKEPIDGLCPDSPVGNVKNTYKCCPVEKAYKEESKAISDKDYGPCTLFAKSYESYSDNPIVGYAHLTTGD